MGRIMMIGGASDHRWSLAHAYEYAEKRSAMLMVLSWDGEG